MDAQAFSAFAGQTYLNLETLRQSGEGVKTPVWFVEEDGTLYVRTIASSAKVKRLRQNPHVRVAPCEVDGTLKGEWVAAVAQVIESKTVAAHVNDLMDQKYGEAKRQFELRNLSANHEMAAVALTVRG